MAMNRAIAMGDGMGRLWWENGLVGVAGSDRLGVVSRSVFLDPPAGALTDTTVARMNERKHEPWHVRPAL